MRDAWISRNSHSEVFLEKGVLKTCSKFTGEHPCRNVISIKLLKSRWKSNKYTFQGHKKNKNKAFDAELKIKYNLTWAFCQHQTLQAIFIVMQRIFAFETISTDSLSCIEQNIKSNKNGWSIKDIKIITKLIS